MGVFIQVPKAIYQYPDGDVHKILKAGLFDEHEEFLNDHLEFLLIDLAVIKDNCFNGLGCS